MEVRKAGRPGGGVPAVLDIERTKTIRTPGSNRGYHIKRYHYGGRASKCLPVIA